ncbi:MAG: hypothetical protein EAZ44_05965 [Cytophagia bacterium]|nr:MAG: hypothetical protein EAZ44_05965 [Cytophagia bacterium]TAG42862.1 MAG: hypothetical protein EAZ31_05440 [Cytophagia bacterium]
MRKEKKIQIFATGVHLQSIQVEINNKKQWRWIAIGFEEDNYYDGETIEVYDYADSFEGLFQNNDEQQGNSI